MNIQAFQTIWEITDQALSFTETRKLYEQDLGDQVHCVRAREKALGTIHCAKKSICCMINECQISVNFHQFDTRSKTR